MRIADLDTSRGDECPSGWTKITTNDAGQPSIDVCRSPSDDAGCYPARFHVHGTSYHKICGKQGDTEDLQLMHLLLLTRVLTVHM